MNSHASLVRSTVSVPAHPATAHLLSPRVQAQKKLSSPFNFRFWKSSSPLSQQESQQQQQQHISSNLSSSNAKSKIHHHPIPVAKVSGTAGKKKSVLQRAVSFDSRGYSKLIQGESVDIESPTQSIRGEAEFLLQDNNNVRATPQVKLSSPTFYSGISLSIDFHSELSIQVSFFPSINFHSELSLSFLSLNIYTLSFLTLFLSFFIYVSLSLYLPY